MGAIMCQLGARGSKVYRYIKYHSELINCGNSYESRKKQHEVSAQRRRGEATYSHKFELQQAYEWQEFGEYQEFGMVQAIASESGTSGMTSPECY